MDTTETCQPLAVLSSEELGPLPPQRKGQYLTMTICGTTDDPAECGHWSSPERVQQRIAKAVAEERERCAKVCEAFDDEGGAGEAWAQRVAGAVRKGA